MLNVFCVTSSAVSITIETSLSTSLVPPKALYNIDPHPICITDIWVTIIKFYTLIDITQVINNIYVAIQIQYVWFSAATAVASR